MHSDKRISNYVLKFFFHLYKLELLFNWTNLTKKNFIILTNSNQLLSILRFFEKKIPLTYLILVFEELKT